MNPFIVNFYNLFSKDQNIVTNAVYLKKDWMFRKLYFPVTFEYTLENGKEMYHDLYATLDQSILFKKAKFDISLFENHHQQEVITNEFNKFFRVAYCYERIPTNLKDTFFVEVDFKKIDPKAYKELVCNFYPCLENKDDLDLWYEEKNDVDLLKYPMFGEDRKWVFILPVENLPYERYYLPIFKKIYYQKSLSDDKIDAIKEIAESLNLEMEEI